jgi:hypothetical protein
MAAGGPPGNRPTGAELLQDLGCQIWKPHCNEGNGDCGFGAPVLGRNLDLDKQGVKDGARALRSAVVAKFRDAVACGSQRYGDVTATLERANALERGPDPSDDATWADRDTMLAAADVLGVTIVVTEML